MGRRWVAAGLWVLVAAGCSDDGPTAVPNPTVQTVSVVPVQSALVVGDTTTVRAIAVTSQGDTLSTFEVAWTLSQGDVVALEGTGATIRARAAGAGGTRVTATVSGRSGFADLSVANPVPVVNDIAPDSVSPGSGSFQLTVLGTGFVQGSVVQWNGSPRATTYLAPGELRAQITAADVATAGEIQVRVVNAQPGGGASANQNFKVTNVDTQPQPGVVASVTISADSLVLGEGDVTQLSAVARDASGAVVTGRAVVWTAVDAEIAHVDALGAVTAVRNGSTLVRARVDGVTAEITARVATTYGFDLVYSGWPTADATSPRFYRTDLADVTRAAVRAGPDAPSSGAMPSPDGSRVAYLLDSGTGLRRLMVSRADGTDAVELHITQDISCGRFSWSPDGSRIAFGCAIGDSDRDIWVVNSNGSGLTNLTDTHPGHQDWPSWSPDLAGGMNRIAYARTEAGRTNIWTMASDGSDPQQVTTGDYDHMPAWSPGGGSIAFQRITASIFGDIWLVNAAGGGEQGLVGLYLAGTQDAPAWSPDGRFLAFSSTHETYGSGQTLMHQIYTVWADGSKLARRTDGSFQASHPAWGTR